MLSIETRNGPPMSSTDGKKFAEAGSDERLEG
jgi:hypothetical protein